MKVLKVFSLVLILFLVGCSKEKYIVCNVDINNDLQDYSNIGAYKIYYKNNYVTKIEKQEKYISKDKDVIKYFKDYKELEYYDLNDKYGGITYNINDIENGIKISSNFDFKLIDVNSMAKDGKIDRDFVILGKLTLGGIKSIYKSRGAVCEE